MSVRRKFVLLLSAAVWAFAFAFAVPARAPGLGSIESAAPPYFDALTSTTPLAENDGTLDALHQQASLALTQLQVRTDGN
jgi:hypothetical protein